MRTVEQRKQTEEFITSLTSRPGIQPKLRVAPQPQGEELISQERLDSEVEDPLLDLLRNHECFSEEMFLQALKSQRSRDVVESQESATLPSANC